jgi:pimeloyl-ACP methyl ester carboxylesterase
MRPPLVLLYGGGDTIKTSFAHILPELARNRQVIAFEQQGYGHTADISDRPFSFEHSADETVALLDYLNIRQADLFGVSNGGTIALQVAIRHPHRVRKLVIASGFFSHDGADPAFWNGFAEVTLDSMLPGHGRFEVPAAPTPFLGGILPPVAESHKSQARTCNQRVRRRLQRNSDPLRLPAESMEQPFRSLLRDAGSKKSGP